MLLVPNTLYRVARRVVSGRSKQYLLRDNSSGHPVYFHQILVPIINIKSNTFYFLIQYQYQYQYLKIWKGIPISILIPQNSKLNTNTNTDTQIFKIQYQYHYDTKVSRYFAISRQYQKNSSRYRAFRRHMFWPNVRKFRVNNFLIFHLVDGPPKVFLRKALLQPCREGCSGTLRIKLHSFFPSSYKTSICQELIFVQLSNVIVFSK